ncbi:MAG: Na-K-Cl cotransporter [Myxococcota bacterium]|jgi:amino acid transporter|nr:Na-K-Cl cotransporter [Myxococcota bacterium]
MAKGYGFGTFKGVYTPSLLTILGVIMYLRFGWVLGNVGLAGTLAIVVLSTSITFFTGLSISALATNMRIGGGGAYYMISRSLGVEVGAAVGLPLYFAQALGISFYIAGFAESVNQLYPQFAIPVIGVITLIALTVLAYVSADLALKSQFFILLVIVASLISFFFGEPLAAQSIDPQSVPDKESFWVVFAVFFPAVTGIEAGVAMSGDLKNPSRSLPLGTLGAIATGFAVYITIPIFLGKMVQQNELLLMNPLIMQEVAVYGGLIICGVWGATLSSALGALLGAPRTLQALARDRVLPQIIGKGFGRSDDPRIATAISFLVALAGVVAGDLNLIAPILSMFFLTSYGILNLSSGFSSLIGSPSWRPRFKVHWSLSIFGSIACGATMIMINPGATILAAVVSGSVYYVMQRRRLRAHFGDVRYGIFMLWAQQAVRFLSRAKVDERNWRPNILAFVGSMKARWYLIDLADALTRHGGFLTLATILNRGSATPERVRTISDSIQKHMQVKGMDALVKVHESQSPLKGARELVNAYGFGPLLPNIILIGDTEKEENLLDYAKLVRAAHLNQRSLIIVRQEAMLEEKTGEGWGEDEVKRIDVWWGQRHNNASLMLALAHLLTQSPQWEDARLVLHTIVDAEEEMEQASIELKQRMTQARLEGEVALEMREGRSVFDCIRAASQGADLVFLGMKAPELDESAEDYATYYEALMHNTRELPPTAIVLAATDLDYRKLLD